MKIKQGVAAMLRKPLFFLLAFLFGPALVGLFVPKAEAATLLYSNEFESGLGDVQKHVVCHPYTYSTVSSPARTGSKAVRHFMKGTEPCLDFSGEMKHRALLRHGYNLNLRFKPRTPYWFGFSMFVPDDYPSHRTDGHFFFGLSSQFPGETAALIRNGKLQFRRRWTNGTMQEVTEASVPVQKGKWTDIVIYLWRSWESDGVLKVWVDGNLIVNTKNKNATNYAASGAKDPYFRTGIYWGTEIREDDYTLYFDSIKVAEGANGYDLVAPTGSVLGLPVAPTGLALKKQQQTNQ